MCDFVKDEVCGRIISGSLSECITAANGDISTLCYVSAVVATYPLSHLVFLRSTATDGVNKNKEGSGDSGVLLHLQLPSVECMARAELFLQQPHCVQHYQVDKKSRTAVVVILQDQDKDTFLASIADIIHDVTKKKEQQGIGDAQETKKEAKASPWYVAQKETILAAMATQGQNEAFVYSLGECRRSVRQLQDELTNIDMLFYAIKANSSPQLLEIVFAAGFGFECVSMAEVQFVMDLFLARDASIHTRILFTPNFAPLQEYRHAVSANVILTIDNLWVFGQPAWREVLNGHDIFVRVDPGTGKGHHAHVRTGGGGSKFGIAVDDLLENAANVNANVIGLHVHAGSGILDDLENWGHNATLLQTLCTQFPNVKTLDLGGGLGVPYRPTDMPLDLKSVNQALDMFRGTHPEMKLWMEPGRFVSASCGVLIARVTQLKRKLGGKNFIGVSTGMNSLIRPALYSSYHHIVNLSRLEDELDDTVLFDIVGPICETGDVLGHDRTVPCKTAEGDFLLVENAGAYGRCMSSDYNMRTPASAIFLK